VWIEFGGIEEGVVGLIEEALRGMGTRDSGLRARLLARLSAAMAYSDLRERTVSLSQQAVEMARRIGDSGALAYAMAARQFTGGPDDVEERLAAASELISVASAANSEMVLEGRFWRLHALLELGDRPAVDVELEAIVRGAEKWRQPRYLYFAGLLRTMRALLDGRAAESERLAYEALALGQRWSPPAAAQALGIHMFTLRSVQGGLEELEETFNGLVQQYPGLPGFRAALAYLYSESGRQEEARTEFERVAASDFTDLPRNFPWLPTLAGLSEVCAFLGDRERAATLYNLLLPYARRNIVASPGGPVYGSVSHYLGVLARTMSRWDEGARHFDDALTLHVRMGARPHVALTQHEFATMLVARGGPGDLDKALKLLGPALRTTEKLGLRRLRDKVMALKREVLDRASPGVRTGVGAGGSEGPDDTGVTVPVQLEAGLSAQTGVFRKEGDYWAIAYEGTEFRLKESVGLCYLAELLSHPGREFLAIDLVTTFHRDWTNLSTPPCGVTGEQGCTVASPHPMLKDAGPILDPQAKMAYRRRLADLREELKEAQGFNDLERASRMQEEIGFLRDELARALGLGGRDRKAASHVERARVSVTRAIRAAVRKIGRNNPALGRHLTATIKTGTFCCYTSRPTPPVCWTF
jgi:tetratricopeptide (TPR) repeat protein